MLTSARSVPLPVHVHALCCPCVQVVAARALSAARAAAEELAPTPGLSSSLCVQLAGLLHQHVAEVMLSSDADKAGEDQTLKVFDINSSICLCEQTGQKLCFGSRCVMLPRRGDQTLKVSIFRFFA